MPKEQSFIDDLSSINLMYLMYAKELAKTHPTEAIWVLGLSADEVENISQLTPNYMNQLAKCGRTIMRIKIPDITNSVVGMGELTILMGMVENEEQQTA
ncbi:hypothetical protein JCM14076_31960 [Methylosoma difficile]|nr:flagellar transcriptional regulator FlhD [Methylovulum sp.]